MRIATRRSGILWDQGAESDGGSLCGGGEFSLLKRCIQAKTMLLTALWLFPHSRVTRKSTTSDPSRSVKICTGWCHMGTPRHGKIKAK
mmetsp:Transcript_12559/g.25493  ORF Transcript_12559/g.25493 Transcript_12559/m.25493 type:complete len:88 (+) Transcript_12559:290-553(+)